MDGFPMDTAQAAAFVQIIGPPTTVIYVDLEPNVMNFRLKNRKNFDDLQTSIDKRISKFMETTLPLVKEWGGIKIDGNGKEDDVFGAIKEALAQKEIFREKELNVNIS